MRISLLLLAGWLAAALLARADDDQPPLKQFDGHTSLTTADFTVPDGWEIRWHSKQVLSIGIIRRDNTVVAGTTGKYLGSLYVPQGGTYRLRIKGEDPILWDITIYAVNPQGNNPPISDDDADFFQPTPGPAYTAIPIVAPDTNAAPAVADQTAPAADTNAAPQAPATPIIPTALSPDQLRAIVAIRGDRLHGEGFFMKTANGTVLITAQQLLANNPNVQFTASNGAAVKVTKIECATDRDVARLTVEDAGFATLPQGDASQLASSDSLLTADTNGQSYSDATFSSATPKCLEAEQIRPIIGAPLVLARNGQVVGMIDTTPQALASDHFNESNFDTRDAMTSFAPTSLRLDNIPSWDVCDLAKLQVQGQFLETFHQRSRRLDAYINGSGTPHATKLWQTDDKIKSANDTFLQDTSGNAGGKNDALHALLFELGVVADTDMDQIQQPGNFYTFQGQHAHDEVTYRQDLKAQVDAYDSEVSKFMPIVARNNGN